MHLFPGALPPFLLSLILHTPDHPRTKSYVKTISCDDQRMAEKLVIFAGSDRDKERIREGACDTC
jgi:hypothetical protein